MPQQGEKRIAIVHDELTRRGGAEIVLEELLRLFPQADVYSLYAGNDARLIVDDRAYEIFTSYLQKLPLWFRRHPSRVLPLLPQAAEQFDLSSYDLVISSASGFAKSIVTRVSVPHITYCHTPTRYLWDTTHASVSGAPFIKRSVGRVVLHVLRLSDYAAAQRVDQFMANSLYTQRRIRHFYRRSSHVIYPPVDTTYFTPNYDVRREDYWLCVGRLTPSKHFDQAVRVCEKLGLPLVVIGEGAELSHLRRIGHGSVKFVGHVSREKLRDYYRRARALLQPGIEDFGMAAVEAMACGTPVIAIGIGGAREVVDHQVTGLLYEEKREESLAEALRQFISRTKPWHAEVLQSSALRFSLFNWRRAMREQVEKSFSHRS